MIDHRRAIALALIVAGVATGAAAQPGDGPFRHGDRDAGGRAERIAHVDAMFRMFDADRDGRVTAAEIDARRKARFAAADADGDGRLGAAEFDAMRRATETERMAARLDADGDGFLTEAELAAREPRMLNRLDADGDGVLTRDEALTARHGQGRMRRD
jgi:hypothetical protein